MGDRLSFFSSQSPDSSRRHGNTQNSRGQEFAPPWAIKPGTYGRDAHIHRARAEMKRLISTKGPTTSWLFSEHYSQPPKGGNHGPAPLQKKLTVGSVSDPLEKEADAVADRVMRNPQDCYLDPPVSPFRQSGQRKPGGETIARQGPNPQEEETAQLKSAAPDISRMPEQDEEMQQAPAISRMPEQDEEMQQTPMISRVNEEEDMETTTMSMQREGAASPEGGTVSNDVAQKIDGVRNSGGEKLPESEREFFESRMGHDFGDVRIHTGSEAAQVSRDVNARAFTIGRDVVFGEEEYKPGTPEGRRLMAHELTHTVQQGAAPAAGSIQRYAAPTDWLDYLSLTFNAAELAYIEYALPEGDYKNFRRLLNALFWAIDLSFAALPGAGGGGAVLRIAGQGGGALVWKVIPQSMRMEAIRTAARQVGIPAMRASQLINGYFDVATQTTPGKEVVQAVSDLAKVAAQANGVSRAAIGNVDDVAKEAPPEIWRDGTPSELYPEVARQMNELIQLLNRDSVGRPPSQEPDPDKAGKLARLLKKLHEALDVLQKNAYPNKRVTRQITWLKKLVQKIAPRNMD